MLPSNALTLLLAADFHLDSPFAALPPDEGERRRAQLRDDFSAAARLARERGARLFLIAGDLFDRREVSPTTLELVAWEISACEAAGVRVFLAPGNHDPYEPGGVWDRLAERAPSAYIFREEAPQRVTLPDLGVDLFGYAFRSPYLAACPIENLLPDPARTSIFLGHAEIDGPAGSGYAPLPRAQAAASGMDLVALGHIHKGTAGLESVGRTLLAVPGCPEGRGFDETGRKGVLLVTLSREGSYADLLPVCERRFEVLTLDVTGVEEGEELSRRLLSLFQDSGVNEFTTLRVRLCGEMSGDLRADLPAAKDALASRAKEIFWQDETAPALSLDEEALARDTGLRGFFYHELLPALQSPVEGERARARDALRYGLAALENRELGGGE